MPELIQIIDNMDEGLFTDIPSPKISPSSWTDARNVSFDDGVVRKSKGQEQVIVPNVVPYFLMPAAEGSDEYWIYAGLAKAWAFLGTTQGDITRVSGDYTGGKLNPWNGGMFHGIPYLNNGVDIPQTWDPISLTQPLVDMPGWPATQTAKVVRDYKSFLVALDVTKSGTRDVRMVKWSAAAPAGALPGSWDETDPTKDAGEIELPEGSDIVVDGKRMGDSFGIYTQQQFWLMDFVGGAFVHRFRKRFDTLGLLAQDCAVQFKGNHFAVTQDDIVLHDGSRANSIAEPKIRRTFFNTVNEPLSRLTRVVVNPLDNEIWICFPTLESALLNRALIWNWRSNSWTFRDLPDIRAIAFSTRNTLANPEIWDEDPDTWDVETKTWSAVGVPPEENVILMSPEDTTGIVKVRKVFTFDGTNYKSFVERRGITVIATGTGDFVPVGSTVRGRVIQDQDRFRLGLSVKPLVEAPDGTILYIFFGAHDTIKGPIRWEGPKTFVVGRDDKVDLYPSGKYLALRIEEKGDRDWKLLGYVIEVAAGGRF